MEQLWEFLSNNKDAVDTLLKIFAFLGISSAAGVIGWAINRWWKQRVRIDVEIFEVITDPAKLLPKLYGTENDDSPLADHRITYQPRDSDEDIQSKLKVALNRTRYLLISAPTGYGKTREAGVLAQTMMLEGWRVLRIKTGWLDTPKTLPDELNNNRSRVLVLLDDLNGLFSTGERTQSPRAEQIPMLSQASYHDRLLQVLDMLEGMCTKREIRVIATARSETDQWKLLDYDEKDKLWKRFEHIELLEPKYSTIIDLLTNTTKQAKMKANTDEFEAIARKSDGTYQNILLNLRRWKAQNKKVDADDFMDTLNGSWRDVYERAIRKYPVSEFIYISIYLLQQYKFPPHSFLVKSLAHKITHKNIFIRSIRFIQINKALSYLIKNENILSPKDGQIEACPATEKLQPTEYLRKLLEVLILPGFLHTDQIEVPLIQTIFQVLSLASKEQRKNKYLLFYSVIALSLHFPLEQIAMYHYSKGRKEKALSLLKDRRKLSSYTIGLLSFLYFEQGEKEKAISLLEQSTSELYQDSSILHSELGLRYKDLDRYDEAEAAYRKAIEINPENAAAYSNLGILLHENFKRYDEAEAAYRKAIELNPREATAYFYLGLLLHENFKRYDEAKAAYRKAIKLNPEYTRAYNNLVVLLRLTDRFDDAMETMFKINPEDFISHLANVLISKQFTKDYPPDYIDRARQLIDWYYRACLDSIAGDFDLAFEYLKKVTEQDRFNSKWAWNDPDLKWLRNDPRFTEIVGPKLE